MSLYWQTIFGVPFQKKEIKLLKTSFLTSNSETASLMSVMRLRNLINCFFKFCFYCLNNNALKFVPLLEQYNFAKLQNPISKFGIAKMFKKNFIKYILYYLWQSFLTTSKNFEEILDVTPTHFKANFCSTVLNYTVSWICLKWFL